MTHEREFAILINVAQTDNPDTFDGPDGPDRSGPDDPAERPTTVDTLAASTIRPATPATDAAAESAQAKVDVLESRRRLRSTGGAIRSWSNRPSGRFAVPALLIALLLLVAGVIGYFVVPNTAPPQAAGSPGPVQSAVVDGSVPTAGDAPDPGPSGSAGSGAGSTFSPPAGIKERPADALAAWAAPIAVKLDIPPVAMQAYGYAQLVTARTAPQCKLTWTTLAGIGKIESDHGRSGGSLLQEDGKSVPPIIGPPLDGQSNRQSVPDTDNGTIDTDRSWDRAVGAMQFIPATWKQYGVDADNDGQIDINDIDDASLTAAVFLCADGRDLSTPAGWDAAIRAYNMPDSYRTSVFNATNDYGRRSRSVSIA